jgi:hypothetical protein
MLVDCEKPQLFVGTNKIVSNQHHFLCNLSMSKSLLEEISSMKISILNIRAIFLPIYSSSQFNEKY